MKLIYILTAALLSFTMLLTSCGGTEPEFHEDTAGTADTTAEEVAPTEETETEATVSTPPSTSNGSFTTYQKLTISEDNAPYYDAAAGLFVVPFSDFGVHYQASDACAIGLSADGEADSMNGTIVMDAHPEFADGDYFTGVTVKPSDTPYDGKYAVTITFGTYLVAFTCTIG